MKLNVNYIGLVRYKTVKVAKLDSIARIVFSHTKFPHLRPAQRHNVLVSVCLSVVGAVATLLITFADKEKAQYVLCFAATNSLVSVKCKFRNDFRRKPPHVKNIHRSFEQFEEAGIVCKRKSSGRPAVTEANVERFRQSFIRSTNKSISRRSLRNSNFNCVQSSL